MKILCHSKNWYIVSKFDLEEVLMKVPIGSILIFGQGKTFLGPGWILIDWDTGEVLYEVKESTRFSIF